MNIVEGKRKECLNFLEDKSCYKLERETVIKRTVTVVGGVKGFWKVGVAGTSVDPWKEGKMKIYPAIAWYKAAK